MLSCREFVELFLDEWREGTLPPRRQRECDRHVRDCGDCARYVDSYLATVVALRAEAALATTATAGVPEDLVRSILRDRP